MTRWRGLTGNQNRILLAPGEISPNIKNAVIAIEDKRFYEHEGVDYQGIARALWQDIRRQRAAQGGSTITQQFVKNALSAQGDRSVFQKLREAALAYHLERKWSKDKVLTQYLNSVYFGNGAYGVESAVRTYFGVPTLQPDGTMAEVYSAGDHVAADATPAEAALLAGHDRLAHASTTRWRTRARPSAGATWCSPACSSSGRSRTPSTRRGSRAAAHASGHRSAGGGLEPAVLLDLAHAAARGPLPAGDRVRRRARDQDDHRPRAPGGGGAGDLGPALRHTGRAPRSWRSRTRRAR